MKNIIKIIIIILVIFLITSLFKNSKNNNINKIIIEDYEPKYYINDLYKSNEINYRLLLDDNEKQLYEMMIEKFINFESGFIVDLSNFNYDYDALYLREVSKIIDAILMDHPELIHVGVITTTKQKGSKKATVNPSYVMTKETYTNNIEKVKKIIEKVKVETVNLDEYNKVKYVYDYIGRNNNYGNTSDSMAQSAYSAFDGQLSPVCAGYAKASQILFNNIKVNSLLITGDSKYALFLGIAHSWNVVEIESDFYLYDVTMSSGGKTDREFYKGFLIDDNQHSPSYKETYPYINGMKYKN